MLTSPLCALQLNKKLIAVGQSDAPSPLKALQRAPLVAGFAVELLALFFGKAQDVGTYDLSADGAALVY